MLLLAAISPLALYKLDCISSLPKGRSHPQAKMGRRMIFFSFAAPGRPRSTFRGEFRNPRADKRKGAGNLYCNQPIALELDAFLPTVAAFFSLIGHAHGMLIDAVVRARLVLYRYSHPVLWCFRDEKTKSTRGIEGSTQSFLTTHLENGAFASSCLPLCRL
jgi:hypothetical protein